MFNMHVLKPYWDDVVLIVVYLINHMTSSIPNNKSSFSLLYPGEPSFSLTPRVFGCIAFVHVLTPSQDKLSPHSVKCIFLGYSRTHKCYICYVPVSHQYYTSADVTFFESSFFSETGRTNTFDLVSSS